MQIRCASCSEMIDAPADWSGKGFACPECGKDVTVAETLAPDAGGAPDGLDVKQMPEGAFRIEYGRRNLAQQVLLGLFSLGTFGHVIYISARRFAEGSSGDAQIWFLIAEGLFFLFLVRLTLRSIFGRHAIEFDARGISKCFRLPPLSERRKVFLAENIDALGVAAVEGAKPGDGSPRWLQLMVGGKRVVLVTDMPLPHLEWMRDRICAVVGTARGDT